MGKILEFTGGKLTIRTKAVEAVDISPDDSKVVRIFLSFGPYNARFDSEECALSAYNSIVSEMKQDDQV